MGKKKAVEKPEAAKKVSRPKKSRKRETKENAAVEAVEAKAPVAAPVVPTVKPEKPVWGAGQKARLEAEERTRIHKARKAAAVGPRVAKAAAP